jgi:arginine/serine-rich splicing factor 4/5/6
MGSRVYLGNLPSRVRERDLDKFLKGYGRVREIMLKNGYGFVEFDDYRDADDAVYELNGKDLLGERIILEHARGTPHGRDLLRDRERGYYVNSKPRNRDNRYGPPVRTEYRLTVENLSSRVSWQDLKDYMRQAGEVTYADAHKSHKNEGVVEFATYSDMKTAIDKLDDTEINGRRIRLVEDRPRTSRKRSHSRSASRSRSRSRSRSGGRNRTRSRSRSRSASRSKSASKSRSRSRTPASKSKSRSKSRSPARNNHQDDHDMEKSDKED